MVLTRSQNVFLYRLIRTGLHPGFSGGNPTGRSIKQPEKLRKYLPKITRLCHLFQ
jgi:hypothetical protein